MQTTEENTSVQKTRKPPDSPPDILDLPSDPRLGNIIRLVANSKKPAKNSTHTSQKHMPLSQADLIRCTEKLAEDAKNGTLKGIGGFAEYEDGYIFGLEGSYLENPGAAVLPLIRLQRRVMSQVEAEED